MVGVISRLTVYPNVGHLRHLRVMYKTVNDELLNFWQLEDFLEIS